MKPVVRSATTTNTAPTPSPSTATNASSGDTVADAGEATTAIDNNQVSAGVAAGGTGSMDVSNTHTSSVTDSSAASAGSGVSVVLVPTPAPGSTPQTGITTANSGTTTATGLDATNAVHNTSVQAVAVGGASGAPVTVASNSNVAIQDTGASGATSGAAWAVVAGANGAPSNVATPVTSTTATTDAVSATGLQATTNLAQASVATVTVPGGAAHATAINITPGEVASVANSGLASVRTGAACAGATCPSGSATVDGATQASSGAASAQGLVAQNAVNTNADVSVKVAGQNFAPIQVVVNSLTQILNLGVGSATSGDTTASNSAHPSATSSGQTASSGAAQATGAQVQNTIDLRSSASVVVQGDNFNPINIVMTLAANLANWGAGLASSGDAQSSGSGGSASSGTATANGLLVTNLVNMWASASVDVEGNNYAPITITINFTTNIDNRGYAGASSGNVAAGSLTTAGAAPSSSPAPSGSSNTSASGSAASGGSAHGGDAVAISNSSTASVVSSQISSANGSKSIDTTTIGTMLSNLPTGDWNPFANQPVAPNATPTIVAGLSSRSGDSTAMGLRSVVNQTNSQIAACSDPVVSCVASNTESHSIVVQDSPNNPATTGGGNNNNGDTTPGPPGTSSNAGCACINATPTPTPSPRTSANSDDNSASRDSGSHSSVGPRRNQTQFSSRTVAVAEPPADGHMVIVNLWDQWPGRRLPPMPNLPTTNPATNSVTASLGGWPGADELPLPDPQAAADDSGSAARGGATTRTLSRPFAPSADVAADSEDEDYPLLDVRQFDVYGWPSAESLPMPSQVVVAAATTAQEQQSDTAIAAMPDDSGATPAGLGGEALLALFALAVTATLVGVRQGRIYLARRRATFRLSVAHGFARRRGTFRLTRPHAPAFLRLVLGLLRLW